MAMQATYPLERAPLGFADGREVWLKREDLHELGAFKWRGAEPVIAAYSAQGASSVITASTGNHAAATAWAAERRSMKAIVYVPSTCSATKLELLRTLHAEVRVVDGDLDAAKDVAREAAEQVASPFFEDGAEPAQYDGYGVIASEILTSISPSVVVVPVGNGALLGGVGRVLGARAPNVERVGVVARAAPVMSWSFLAGRPVRCDRSATIADGLAVRVAIPRAVDRLRSSADRIVEVSERALASAVAAFADAVIRVEPAAAAPLAALQSLDAEGPVVLIVTGRNVDDELYDQIVSAPDSFSD
jgi:threonine dehydratase